MSDALPSVPTLRRLDAVLDAQSLCWREGETVSVETYLERDPELRGDDEAVLALIYNEVVCRERRGEKPEMADYQRRFPNLNGPLQDQFDVHRALSAEAPTLTPFGLGEKLTAVGEVRIPGFEIGPELGRGGMAVIYQARQTRLNRVVALKMILGGNRGEPKELVRFLAEAEAVAAVEHPHVVQVYEYGEHDGQPFLAMEYLPGGTLADRLRAIGRFDDDAAARLVGKLASAIQSAHDQGIVHRDLKPGNVLFDAAGEPRVTDFGLAKRGGGNLTASRAVMGTPAYMAPEQARGDTKFVGPGADVYSLGVILYECLTGTIPFDAADPLSLVRKVAEEEPEPPGKRAPGIPRDVELICLKCLAKDPADRYRTAGALAADLAHFVAGEPVAVRSAGMIERGYKWARRNPTRASAYALTFAVLVLIVFGASLATLWRAAERERGAAETTRDSLAVQKKVAETARDGEQQARAATESALDGEATARRKLEAAQVLLRAVGYGQKLELAQEEWRDNNVLAALAHLDNTPVDLRGWEWLFVHRLCHSDLMTLRAHTAQVSSAAYSNDGLRVVTASRDGTAIVWNAHIGTVICMLAGHRGFVNSAAFSPNGLLVVTASKDGTVFVWDAQTGAFRFQIGDRSPEVKSASFSPDGNRIVTASSDGTVKVWDVNTKALVVPELKHPAAVNSAAFSPDNSLIVTGCDDRRARVWDVKKREIRHLLKGHTGRIGSVAYSADGARIVTASDDGTAMTWDATNGVSLRTFVGHAGFVTSASFNYDRSRVVTGGNDGTARVWDVSTGTQILLLKGHLGGLYSATFSPDGSRVVTASFDQTARIWDAMERRDVLTMAVPGKNGAVQSASFRRNELWVATASQNGMVNLWNAETGKEVGAFEHPSAVFSVEFSRDGSQIATGCQDGIARVWDTNRKALLRELDHHKKVVRSASFSPDGSQIVTGCMDGNAYAWEATTDVPIGAFKKENTSGVYSVAFSADSLRIVTGNDDGTVRVWDAKTRKALHVIHTGHAVYANALSADGSKIVAGGRDVAARVYDTATGSILHTLVGHTSAIWSVSFSPDGSRIVTGSKDRTAKVWDAKTGVPVLTLRGHTNTVQSVSFSLDGSQILTGSLDGTAKIWDSRPVNPDFMPKEMAPLPRVLR